MRLPDEEKAISVIFPAVNYVYVALLCTIYGFKTVI
jgi:hypothetical protein